MKLFLNIIALFCSLPITSSLYAQDIPIPDYSIYNSGRMGTLITQMVIDNEQGKGTTQKKTSTTPAGKTVSLVYAPTPAFKKQVINGYVQRLQSTNPASAKAVSDNFASGKYDYGTIYSGLIKGDGLQENNAADVVTSYMVLGYMIVNNILDDKTVTPTMIQALRKNITPILSQNTDLSKAGAAAQLGEEIKLQIVMIHAGWQSAAKENTLPAYRQGVNGIFKNQWGIDMSKIKLTNNGIASTTAPVSNTTPNTNTQATSNGNSTATAAGNAPGVAGWFFRAISGYPAAISYEPVVLFSNGEYVEVGEQPLESINVAQSKQSRPTAWGTWQKNGASYVLTNAKKQSNDYKLGDGSWFPAYPFPSGLSLKKGYERVSGGDYGGGTTALSVSKIYFVDATHFQEGTNTGVISPNATGGNKSSAAGTYRIHGNTLELTYNNGKTVKTSFAFGATDTPARPTNTMLFIGGVPYTDID